MPILLSAKHRAAGLLSCKCQTCNAILPSSNATHTFNAQPPIM